MNLLDALIIVRAYALKSVEPMADTKRGQTALKVLNRKIASLERKKAWREAVSGTMPPHARHPDHPLNQFR